MSHLTLLRSCAPKLTTRRAKRSRGQSLVEFALVLPVILLLTLIALDFGRIYLGYINLQNMARIASNFAANNPNAWGATPDAAVQAKYKNQILADATATNCILPKVGGVTQVPAPTFTDTNGNGLKDLGETVQVQISCSFNVITPGISAIVGDVVTVSAASSFPVKQAIIATAGGGGGGGVAPNAAFTANGVVSGPAVTLSGIKPFAVDFRDSSGGAPNIWDWNLGISTTTAQDPLVITYNTAGSYVVTMVASNAYGSSTATMTINVIDSTAVNFTGTPTAGTTGMTVAFDSSLSTSGGTAFAWTFGTGEGTGTGATTTHTYSTAGTYTVSLTVTYPAPTGPITTTKIGYISVATPLCTVPSLKNNFINTETTNAGAWHTAGFVTANLSIGPGVPKKPGTNWRIRAQSIVAGTQVPCTSLIQVNDH
jgi:PKD repeat protein